MRPTRRGLGAMVVVAGAIALAWLSGARALNAVAAPTLAALLFGTIAVWRAPEPTVTYGSPRAGPSGETRTLRIDVEGGGLVSLAVDPPAGIAGADIDAAVSPPASVEQSVTLDRRGVYRLDPPTVHQRDPLGFVERRVESDATASVVVYPRTYAIETATLRRLLSDDLASERQEFDRLREYVPGDSLRDVHWKSSAKREELLVMEYAQPRGGGTLTVAADATEGHADEMAAAAATLVTGALEVGYDVALTVPTDHLPAGRDDSHRERLLRMLARTDAGTLPDATHGEADVSVRADGEGVRFWIAGREQPFDAVLERGSTAPPEATP